MTSPPEPPAGWLGFLESRLGEAVRISAAGDTDLTDPLRGLYITDEQALALADDAERVDADDRLGLAAELLELDALDTAVLTVCAAPELHPRFGRLYAYLHDDVTRRLASPRLVAALLAVEGIQPEDVLRCFAPGAKLPSLGAISLLPADASAALADRPIKLADRLAAFLLGAGPELGDAASPVPLRRISPAPDVLGRAEAVERVATLLGASNGRPLVVCGPDASALVAAAAGAPLIVITLRDHERPDVASDATLACALEQAVLCVDGLDELGGPDRERLLRAIDARPRPPILLGGARRDAVALGDRTVIVVEIPPPTVAERDVAWRHFTGSDETNAVASTFRLSIAAIREAAEVTMTACRARGGLAPTEDELSLGARHASSSRLGELAAKLEPGYVWEDLVLPDRQRDLLRSISAYLRHRDRVLSEWGYDRPGASSQGLKVLFAGDSGTGKTMAAQVLARVLGLDLYRVDLSTTVSKYIGETEKNLRQIFADAENSNAMLFFDEADALFGRRSEVSDAHDRYANIEVAYLLQRVEAYPGAVILATNFKRNIDDAFLRRLDFVVDFPFPEAEDRRRIWELVLPPEAPLDPDVDLDFLSTNFKLSGGEIRNCSLAAAFRAADDDAPIGMRHLVRAVAQEYAKQGRLTLEADFERFHQVIRETSADRGVTRAER